MVYLTAVFFILVTHAFLSASQDPTTENFNHLMITELPVPRENLNSTLPILSRRRRYVVFPRGSSIQCVYKETLRMFVPLTKRFVFTMTLGLAWKLPTEAHEIYIQKREADLTRAAMAEAGYGVHHRLEMFKMLEGFLSLKGFRGRDCVMRAVCEATEARKISSDEYRGSFMEELHKILFTLPLHPGHKTDYDKARDLAGKCDVVYAGCHSMLDLEV